MIDSPLPAPAPAPAGLANRQRPPPQSSVTPLSLQASPWGTTEVQGQTLGLSLRLSGPLFSHLRNGESEICPVGGTVVLSE